MRRLPLSLALAAGCAATHTVSDARATLDAGAPAPDAPGLDAGIPVDGGSCVAPSFRLEGSPIAAELLAPHDAWWIRRDDGWELAHFDRGYEAIGRGGPFAWLATAGTATEPTVLATRPDGDVLTVLVGPLMATGRRFGFAVHGVDGTLRGPVSEIDVPTEHWFEAIGGSSGAWHVDHWVVLLGLHGELMELELDAAGAVLGAATVTDLEGWTRGPHHHAGRWCGLVGTGSGGATGAFVLEPDGLRVVPITFGTAALGTITARNGVAWAFGPTDSSMQRAELSTGDVVRTTLSTPIRIGYARTRTAVLDDETVAVLRSAGAVSSEPIAYDVFVIEGASVHPPLRLGEPAVGAADGEIRSLGDHFLVRYDGLVDELVPCAP